MIDDPELEKAFDLLMANAVSDVDLVRTYRTRYGLKARSMIDSIEDPQVLRRALHQVLNLVDQQSTMFNEPTWLFTLYRAVIVHLQYYVPMDDDNQQAELSIRMEDDPE